ncbi:hypothetical protein K8I61_13110 [bacterium]|nr:hypothetical protein [bacterium]
MTTSRSIAQGGAISDIASILATAIVRMHLRDVRNRLKKNVKSENGLEVSSAKSLHRLEPKHGEEKR